YSKENNLGIEVVHPVIGKGIRRNISKQCVKYHSDICKILEFKQLPKHQYNYHSYYIFNSLRRFDIEFLFLNHTFCHGKCSVYTTPNYIVPSCAMPNTGKSKNNC